MTGPANHIKLSSFAGKHLKQGIQPLYAIELPLIMQTTLLSSS
jgi:hypothetical protein